jgi:hypothetical protein
MRHFVVNLGRCLRIGSYWGLTAFSVMAADSLESWTERARPAGASAPVSIAFGNGMFVAVGANGTIITSTNGADWSTRTSGTIRNLPLVKFVNGRFFVMANVQGAPQRADPVLSSVDGIAWITLTNSANISDITFDGSSYVGVGLKNATTPKQIYKSTNLVDWVPQNISLMAPFVSAANLTRIHFDKGLYHGGYANGSVTSYTFYSTDALTWTQSSLISTGGVVYTEFVSQNGSVFRTVPMLVEVAGAPVQYHVLSFTSDGTNWQRTLYTRPNTALSAKIAYGGGYYVDAVGTNIFYTNSLPASPTLIENGWPRVALQIAGSGDALASDAVFGNGTFVAIALGRLFTATPPRTAEIHLYSLLPEQSLYAGLTLRGKIGDRFSIESQETVDGNGWTSLAEITLDEEEFRYSDFASITNKQRFYRISYQEALR